MSLRRRERSDGAAERTRSGAGRDVGERDERWPGIARKVRGRAAALWVGEARGISFAPLLFRGPLSLSRGMKGNGTLHRSLEGSAQGLWDAGELRNRGAEPSVSPWGFRRACGSLTGALPAPLTPRGEISPEGSRWGKMPLTETGTQHSTYVPRAPFIVRTG